MLRGFTWADFPAFAAMWQEPEVARFIPFAPISPSTNQARFNGNCSAWVHRGFGNWAVMDQDGGFLGTTGFFRNAAGLGADYDTSIQAGWVFSARSHGKGYATEAVMLAHGWLDQQPFGGRSVCGMDANHAGSIRVAEKAGYTLLRLASNEWGDVQLMERIFR